MEAIDGTVDSKKKQETTLEDPKSGNENNLTIVESTIVRQDNIISPRSQYGSSPRKKKTGSSSSSDSIKREYEVGIQEEEVQLMIEEHRERWIKEDELTYASQVDFDVALMQVVAVEEVSKKQGQQIEANLKLMHE